MAFRTPPDPANCAEVFEEANQHLFELLYEHEETIGMGTTLVGAVLKDDQLLTFNVGDSRSYLFSAGQLIQLSHDDVPEPDDRAGPRSPRHDENRVSQDPHARLRVG